jgi:hypothetical protein
VVRYKGTVVDLNKVAVVRNMLHLFLLGVEWIAKSEAMIRGVGGVARVNMAREFKVCQNPTVEVGGKVTPFPTTNICRIK